MVKNSIKVLEVIENEDGTATIVFENPSEEFKAQVVKFYKAKKFTQKLFQKFVSEGIKNYLKHENL